MPNGNIRIEIQVSDEFMRTGILRRMDIVSISEPNDVPMTGVAKFSCEDCNRQFRFSGNYVKHKLRYPFKHKFWVCCKKVIEDTVVHVCRTRRKTRDVAVETDTIEEEDSGSDEENGEEEEVKTELKDQGEEDVPEWKTEVKSENEDSDAMSDLLPPPKRMYRRRTEAEKADVGGGEFKCEKCPKSFAKSGGLSCHRKVVHQKSDKFKCHTCEEVFNTSDSYYKHLFLHGPEDKVVCKGCRRVFDSLRLYQAHAKQNPGVHCFLCKLCLRKFPTELLLEQHVCICTNGQPMVCACGRSFKRYHDVIIHSRGNKPFHCCCCDHVSMSLTAYLRHMRRHSKQKFYECKTCNLSFAIIDFYNMHNKKVHGLDAEKIALRCSECSESFSTSEELEAHRETHGAERVACPDCGKSLKRSRLESHRNTHKRSASLCPECGRLFDTRFKLTQHLLSAHHADPVKCDICGKVLKTKKILNEHMKTHLKSEIGLRIPQAICPMCGLGLAQKGSLTRHILLMHEKHKIVPCDKTYACPDCAQVLSSKAKYYSHRRMHKAMVDRFPCALCGREFNKKQNLRRHIYLLHDERRIIEDPVYGCQICTRSFREKKNLRRHYKMVHKWHDPVI